MLAKKQRLTGKDVIFITRKRQYIGQGIFGFFYVQQYPSIPNNQISCHITIKLSKRAVVRHLFKRAIMQYVQDHQLIKMSFPTLYYKFFVVLSKDRIGEIDKKIANFSKKDTIKYIQEEFEKAWKGMTSKIAYNKNK